MGSLNSSNTVAKYNYHFRTAPLPRFASPTRFLVLGDSGYVGPRAMAVRDAYRSFASNTGEADFLLMLRGNAYRNGRDSEYQFPPDHQALPSSLSHTIIVL